MKRIIERIHQLLSNGYLADGIKTLVSILELENRYRNEIIHQRGLYEKLEKDKRLGVISQEEYRTNISKVQVAILDILSRLSESDLKKRKVLIFDIDNTVLIKGETLDKGIIGIKRKTTIVGLFKDLVDLGYIIVFITGNDIHKQHPKVVEPILNMGIGESVIIFSDGGSRLFEFDPIANDFRETEEYSEDNELKKDIRIRVKREFEEGLEEFIEENEMLLRPNVSSYDYEISKEGMFEFAEILIKPFNKRFSQSDLIEAFKTEINSRIKKRQIFSPFDFKTNIPNSLIIHVRGRYAHSDSIEIINIVNEVLYIKKFREISKPELNERGGNFISQIAIKPFNAHELREKFLTKLRFRLEKYPECKNLAINFGGTTTIDIQKKGTDKAKAIRYLKEKFHFEPKNMIYWGDEFTINGNDLPIARMSKNSRPALIVHVGDKSRTPENLKNEPGIIFDHTGTQGTINSLLLIHHLNIS